MPFKKVNINNEINKMIENDSEFKNELENVQREYEVVKQLVKMRNDMGWTQNDIAKKSGLTQQMVSRIETVGNSPTLRNLIRYANSLNMDIKIDKKKSHMRNMAGDHA